MADCNSAFFEYITELNLIPTQFGKLQVSRDALLAKISSRFKEASRTIPIYASQGSYALDTINRPISDDYDLDHGVYLVHVPDNTALSVAEAFELVARAVEGHTSQPLGDKPTCVRVQYKQAADGTSAHHVDLAVYRQYSNGRRKFAHKHKDWRDSDQAGFIDMFKKRAANADQLRPLVRVFKGWSDYNGNKPGSVKFPSGFHFTVCAMECLRSSADRLDQAFVATADRILGRLRAQMGGTGSPFLRPVTPFEDIFQDYDWTRRQGIAAQFEHLVREGSRALAEPDLGKAQRIWRELLGERFPAPPEVKVENPDRVWGAPAILGRSDKAG